MLELFSWGWTVSSISTGASVLLFSSSFASSKLSTVDFLLLLRILSVSTTDSYPLYISIGPVSFLIISRSLKGGTFGLETLP